MKCTYEKTIFANKDSGFCIISFSTTDKSVPENARSKFGTEDLINFTATGFGLPTTNKIEVDIDGTWEESKYGLQMKVTSCVELIPNTKDGMIAYLSSGLIYGIGEKLPSQ